MSSAAVEVWSFDADEAESGGGRGQRATRPISTGDVVLSVPLQQCWTAAAALSSPLLSCLAGGIPGLGERDIIALHLLAERFDADARASTDERAAHVTSLPERYDVPMLWSEDEIDNLAGKGTHPHHITARTPSSASLNPSPGHQPTALPILLNIISYINQTTFAENV
jgi:hypothetical protein